MHCITHTHPCTLPLSPLLRGPSSQLHWYRGAPRTQHHFSTSPLPSLAFAHTGLCPHWSLFLDLLPPQASPLLAELSESDPSLDASSSRKPSSIPKEPGPSCLGSNTAPPLTNCGNLDYGSWSVCACVSSAVKQGIQPPYGTCALWTDELWHVKQSEVCLTHSNTVFYYSLCSQCLALPPAATSRQPLSPWASKLLDRREGLVHSSCVSLPSTLPSPQEVFKNKYLLNRIVDLLSIFWLLMSAGTATHRKLSPGQCCLIRWEAWGPQLLPGKTVVLAGRTQPGPHLQSAPTGQLPQALHFLSSGEHLQSAPTGQLPQALHFLSLCLLTWRGQGTPHRAAVRI